MPVIVDVLTIFPEVFLPVLRVGMSGRAITRGAIELHLNNLRDHATDRHRSTDDEPYGGGSGMVMLVEPVVRALDCIAAARGPGHRVLLTPGGQPLRQATVRRLASYPHLVLICGRYEGVDERVTNYINEEISIGDFVLAGGELPALVIIDAISRLAPGVLNNDQSAVDESFEQDLLEYPQYTRPATFRDHAVPPVLLSGNHEQIRRWRRSQSLQRTLQRRPDLFANHRLSDDDRRLLGAATASVSTLSAEGSP
jgi:tRNA (guanine37-N1)-methyltransferase